MTFFRRALASLSDRSYLSTRKRQTEVLNSSPSPPNFVMCLFQTALTTASNVGIFFGISFISFLKGRVGAPLPAPLPFVRYLVVGILLVGLGCTLASNGYRLVGCQRNRNTFRIEFTQNLVQSIQEFHVLLLERHIQNLHHLPFDPCLKNVAVVRLRALHFLVVPCPSVCSLSNAQLGSGPRSNARIAVVKLTQPIPLVHGDGMRIGVQFVHRL